MYASAGGEGGWGGINGAGVEVFGVGVIQLTLNISFVHISGNWIRSGIEEGHF